MISTFFVPGVCQVLISFRPKQSHCPHFCSNRDLASGSLSLNSLQLGFETLLITTPCLLNFCFPSLSVLVQFPRCWEERGRECGLVTGGFIWSGKEKFLCICSSKVWFGSCPQTLAGLICRHCPFQPHYPESCLGVSHCSVSVRFPHAWHGTSPSTHICWLLDKFMEQSDTG